VRPHHIGAYRFPAHGHGTIDPDPDFRGRAARDIAPELRGDLDRETHFARAHAPVQIGVIMQRRTLAEPA
jgi:hypothetical protein